MAFSFAPYPNLKEEVGGSIPGCEISSLPKGKLVKWSTVSCALALTCRHFVTKKNKKTKQIKNKQTKQNKKQTARLIEVSTSY
jgi:hypothetical protein